MIVFSLITLLTSPNTHLSFPMPILDFDLSLSGACLLSLLYPATSRTGGGVGWWWIIVFEGESKEKKKRGRHCENLFHRQCLLMRFVLFSFSVSCGKVHDPTVLLKTEGERLIHLSTFYMFSIFMCSVYALCCSIGAHAVHYDFQGGKQALKTGHMNAWSLTLISA